MGSIGRALGRILLVLTGVATAIALIGGGLAWWVATHPDRAFEIGRRWFLPADLKITWADVHFAPKRITWLHWAVDLTIDRLVVEKGAPKLRVPVDEITLRFEASVWRPETRADFAQVIVRATEPITFEPAPSEDAAETPGQSPFEMVHQYLEYLNVGARYATVERLDIDVRDAHLVRPARGGDIVGRVKIVKPPPDRDAHVIGVDFGAKAADVTLTVAGQIDSAKLGAADAPLIQLVVGFDGFGAHERGDVAINVVGEVVKIGFTGEVSYRAGANTLKFKPDLAVAIDEARADVRLKTSLAGLPAPLPKIEPIDVHLEVPIESGRTWARAPSKLSLAAPVEPFFVDAPLKADLERACDCKLPPKLAVALNGSLWLDVLTHAPRARSPAADLRLEIQSLKNKLFALDLAANAKVFRDKEGWSLEPHLDSAAHLASYQTIRRLLDARNVLIPAPFDALDGTVDLTARDDVKREEGVTETKVDVAVNLASAHQRVDLRANVGLKLASDLKSLEVYVKLLIDMFQIQLPPLEPLAGLPPLAHDARVQMTPPAPPPPANAPPPKKSDGFKVQVYFSVKTVNAGAIRLLSDLAKPHVPITVAVDRALNGDLTGSVQLEPFAITYLRRTVHVEALRMLMDERDPANFPVDGRFRIDQTQYKIFVDVSGTLRSPSTRLSSEPYLPRNEIISVLLYDRTSDGLVSSDAETAGSFEAAVADRAIGLFGLWAFASTPIKSFSYNPVTKVYSATVQLADGLTAGVGTNWEEAASFEVRKRVSRRWVLTASWSPSQISTNQVGKLVLQWEKRF